MKEFKDKVVVITGGASGIGLGLARKAAKEGMKVVLADVERGALDAAEKEIKATGAQTLAVRTDVSKSSEVEALAKKTLDVFGGVHLVFNNAGVMGGGSIWRSSEKDWEWIMGVNLWGVINGVHTFVPIMLEQGTEAHVINTSSTAGLTTGPTTAIYAVTKHAVVALTEVLYHQLLSRNSLVGASVLCPSSVNTNFVDSDRNRPTELRDAAAEQFAASSPKQQAQLEASRASLRQATHPDKVADIVFDAIKVERFYILTEPESIIPAVKKRMENILNERNPGS
jgi:NAD(P)-dependent dehydrogenase (short-subunit alcohol dehydrogenase family)